MSDQELAIVNHLLIRPEKRKLDILEWGCGGSTVYFTKLLGEKGIEYNWNSIEHDPDWFNNIHAQISDDENIHLHLITLDHKQCSEPDGLLDCPYVNFPQSLDQRFDFILVDGRHREACTRLASRLIRDDGKVVVHDAQRKRYHSAFQAFKNGRFLSYRIWAGSNEDTSLLVRTGNRLNYYFYRLIVKRLQKFSGNSFDQ